MRRAISVLISISMLASQAAQGAGIAEALYTTESAVEAYGAKAVRYGFNKEGGYTLSLLNEEKQIVKSMVFPKATPESLKAVSPEALEKETANFPKLSKKEIVINAAVNLKRFPIEAFTFFVALGAIATKDLVFNFSKDPTAIETFLNGQVSVPGQVGFGAFMFMNSVTTQAAMQSALRNKNLSRTMIPYLGMSAGLTASKIVTDLMSFPGYGQMEKCVSLKVGSQNKDEINKACSAAYSTWNDYHFGRKMGQIAPSLISMIAASGIMAVAWASAEKVATLAAGQAVKYMAVQGVELALSLNEVGLAVKAVQVISWGIQIANLAGFVELNDYLEAPILKWWNNNVSVGPALLDLRRQITFDAISSTNKDRMIGNLDEFAKTMEEYQQNNAQETLNAHNNWINYLSNLGSGHDLALAFYKDLVDDVWKNKFGGAGEKIDLLRTYPLYGVKLPNGQDANSAGYLQGAEVREQDQKSVVNHIGEQVEKYIKTYSAWFNELHPEERDSLNEIVKAFKSDDALKIGAVLKKIEWQMAPTAHGMADYHTQSYTTFIKNIYSGLQKPAPIFDPGQGYLLAREKSYKESEFVFPSDIEKREKKLEYLVDKMIFGEEVDGKPELVVKATHGFKAEFNFPRITTRSPEPDRWSHSGYEVYLKTKLKFLSESGIRNEILGSAGSKQSNLDAWWSQNVEPAYLNAWFDFGDKYEKIISSFLNDLRKDPRPLNYVEFSKGLMSSTEQEIKVYVDVLEKLGSKEQRETNKKILPIALTAMSSFEKMVSEIKTHVGPPQVMGSTTVATILRKTVPSAPAMLMKTHESHVSNAKVEQVTKELKSAVDEVLALTKEDAAQRYSADDIAIAKSASEHLVKAFEKLTGYIEIVNAVSYNEKYQNGYYQSDKCTEMKSGGKTLNGVALARGCLSAAVGQ